MRPEAIEFLVHMSLAAAVAVVNNFLDDNDHLVNGFQSVISPPRTQPTWTCHALSTEYGNNGSGSLRPRSADHAQSQYPYPLGMHLHHLSTDHDHETIETSRGLRPIHPMVPTLRLLSVAGANLNLNLTLSDLRNMEYLTDGGNNWIHTAGRHE